MVTGGKTDESIRFSLKIVRYDSILCQQIAIICLLF